MNTIMACASIRTADGKRTDRIDLWQFHEIDWDVDPDWIFDRGALKAALEARQEGKIRFIGFTGHRQSIGVLHFPSSVHGSAT